MGAGEELGSSAGSGQSGEEAVGGDGGFLADVQFNQSGTAPLSL